MFRDHLPEELALITNRMFQRVARRMFCLKLIESWCRFDQTDYVDSMHCIVHIYEIYIEIILITLHCDNGRVLIRTLLDKERFATVKSSIELYID